MTQSSRLLCPHCNGHVHTLAYVPHQAAAPPPRQQAPQLDPQASKASNVCPNCSEWKKAGFELCYPCSMATMDDCPVAGCNRKKKPSFATCYRCKEEGRAAPKPAAAAPNPPPRPAGVHPYDDGYPNADMGPEYESF